MMRNLNMNILTRRPGKAKRMLEKFDEIQDMVLAGGADADEDDFFAPMLDDEAVVCCHVTVYQRGTQSLCTTCDTWYAQYEGDIVQHEYSTTHLTSWRENIGGDDRGCQYPRSFTCRWPVPMVGLLGPRPNAAM